MYANTAVLFSVCLLLFSGTATLASAQSRLPKESVKESLGTMPLRENKTPPIANFPNQPTGSLLSKVLKVVYDDCMVINAMLFKQEATTKNPTVTADFYCQIVVACFKEQGVNNCKKEIQSYDLKRKGSGASALFEASRTGNESLVEQLIKMGFDPNAELGGPSWTGWTPLMIAAAEQHQRPVWILLNAGADPNIPNDLGRTALMFASSHGHTEIVTGLLEKGANPNVVPTDDKGWAALMVAVHNGHAWVVKRLLEQGANPNLVDKQGKTALALAESKGKSEIAGILKAAAKDLGAAAERGDLTAVREILAAGTSVDARGPKMETALLRASRTGRLDIVKLLLEKGADINTASGVYEGGDWITVNRQQTFQTKFQLYSTPLMEATENGHTLVMRMLIDHGAKVNTASYEGKTVLKLAARRGDPEIVALLLSAGADVNLGVPLFGERSASSTALMAAASGQCCSSCVKSVQFSPESFQKTVELLLSAGARTDTRDASNGRTAFINAVLCSASGIAPLLIAGISIDDKDNQGFTALAHAAQKGDVAMVSYLLENRADPNIADNSRNTPLLYAVRGHHTALVEVLAKAGAKVSVSDQGGKTTLMIAVEEDDVLAVNVLITHGADLNAKTELGLTAVQLAKLSRRNNARAILESLERSGARE